MRFHRFGAAWLPLALVSLPAAAQSPCAGVCVSFASAGVSAVPLSPAVLPLLAAVLAALAFVVPRRGGGRLLPALFLAAGLGLAPDLPRALATAYQVVLSGGSLAAVALPGGYAGPVDVHNPQAVPVTITGIEAGAGFVVDPASPLHVGSVVPPGATVAGAILIVAPNTAPTANDFTFATAIGGTAKTGNWKTAAAAADADGDALSATVKTQGSKGTVSVAGDNFTYTPAAGQTGSDTVGLTVADGRGGTRDITVTVTGIDTVPPATTQAAVTSLGAADASLGFTIDEAGTGYYALRAAADPAATADALVTSGTPVVMGAHGSVTANFSGLAGATAYAVDFIARDAAGNRQAAVTTVGFTTLAANVAPVFAAVQGNLAIDNVNAMAPLVTPAATDGNGDPITYGASGLPTGLAFDPATRTLSKTGAVPPGSHTVTLTATDGIAPPVSQSFEVVVANSAPTFGGVLDTVCIDPDFGYSGGGWIEFGDPDGGDITLDLWSDGGDGTLYTQIFIWSPGGEVVGSFGNPSTLTATLPLGTATEAMYSFHPISEPYGTIMARVTDAGGLSTTVTVGQVFSCW